MGENEFGSFSKSGVIISQNDLDACRSLVGQKEGQHEAVGEDFWGQALGDKFPTFREKWETVGF